jgi:hypothetical protein
MKIFTTFWKAARELFDDLFVMIVVNVLWVLMNVPAALVIALAYATGSFAAIGVALLLSVLSLGPANAGLYAIAERITEGRTSSWRDFVAGVRAYARTSLQVYGVWMLGLVILLFNLQFYNLNGSQIGGLVSVLFLYLLIVWFGLLIYIGPLMLLQTDKRLRVIARNAALMTFGRPIFTLGTLLLMAVILVSSIWLIILLFLVTFAFLALWGFRATLRLVADADARRAAADEKAATVETHVKGRGGQVRPRD